MIMSLETEKSIKLKLLVCNYDSEFHRKRRLTQIYIHINIYVYIYITYYSGYIYKWHLVEGMTIETQIQRMSKSYKMCGKT